MLIILYSASQQRLTEKILSTIFWLQYSTRSIRLRVDFLLDDDDVYIVYLFLWNDHKLYQFLKTCTVYLFHRQKWTSL